MISSCRANRSLDTPSTRAMVAMANKAWFALMNWKTRDHRGLPCEPGRCLCQDIALLAPLPVLTPQTGQLLALGAGRAVRSAVVIAIGLTNPVPDRPGQSVRTRATAPPGFAQIGPDQPSVAGTPAHRVGDSSASMAPRSWPAGRRSSRGSAGLLRPPGSDRMLCGGSKGARLPTSLASGHTPFWSHCL